MNTETKYENDGDVCRATTRVTFDEKDGLLMKQMEEKAVKEMRAEILLKAREQITGHREQDYGTPENNFATIASLWSVYLEYPVTPFDVAMCMCLLKIARIKNGGGSGDSFVDLAEYAACAGEIRRNERDGK